MTWWLPNSALDMQPIKGRISRLAEDEAPQSTENTIRTQGCCAEFLTLEQEMDTKTLSPVLEFLSLSEAGLI